MPVAVKRVDPRTKRSRQLLTRAFVELLREQDFQSITVQDVAARATVNRATFYAHFDDKYALLNYAIGDGFRQRVTANLPDSARFTSENLRLLIVALCEFMAEFHSHCSPKDRRLLPLLEANVTTELRDVLLEWLKPAGPAQAGRGASPELAAVVASWAIYGAASQWVREKRSGSAKAFAAQLLPMIAAGLGQTTGNTASRP